MTVSHEPHSPLQECLNLCCNATTCTLKPDAVCAHGLCCEDCQVSSLGPEATPCFGGFHSETGHTTPVLWEL